MKATTSFRTQRIVFARTKARRRGSITLIIAIGIVTVLGAGALAVDLGVLASTRNRLQRSCDAAALAGAAELPASTTARTNSATSYAQATTGENGIATSETTVTFPATNKIQVSAARQVNLFFAPILGIANRTVTATAIAGRANIAGVPYNVPLAITVDDYNRFKDGRRFTPRLVDNNRQNFEDGTVTALDLRNDNSGKSGAGFQEDLTYGWYKPVYFNQQINSALNASLVSQGEKLDRAMDDRFDRAAGAPWYDAGPGSGNSGSNSSYTFPDYPQGDPRIVTIIIADPNPANNNNPQLNARFFAPVYMEEIITRSGDTYVQMRILPFLTYNSDDPNVVVGDDSTPSIGLTVIKLMG
jgi:Flp pilus assembly protein TadG